MNSSAMSKIKSTESYIDSLEKQLSNLQEEITKITWELDRPECCFEENHLVIVTAEGKEFHVNELVIEQKCPLLKEIATISYDKGVKHMQIAIDTPVMAEIISYLTVGIFTPICRFSARYFRIMRMLELYEMQLIGEFDLLNDLDTGNVFAFLNFAEENKLKFMESEILKFVYVNFDIVKNHHGWTNFTRKNPIMTAKIFEMMK